MSEGVRRYRELFFGVGEGVERGEKGMLEGLVVLWGTEKVRFPQENSKRWTDNSV